MSSFLSSGSLDSAVNSSLGSHDGGQSLVGVIVATSNNTTPTNNNTDADDGHAVFDVGGLLSDELGSVLNSRPSTACSASLSATSPENTSLPQPAPLPTSSVVVDTSPSSPQSIQSHQPHNPELTVLQAAGMRAHEQTEALLTFWEDVTARHRNDVNSIHRQRLETRRLLQVGHHTRQNKIPTASNNTATTMSKRDTEHLLTAQYEYLVEGNHHRNLTIQPPSLQQQQQQQQQLSPLESPNQPNLDVSQPNQQKHIQQHDRSHGSYNLLINDLFSGIHAIRQDNEKLKAAVVSGGTYLKGDVVANPKTNTKTAFTTNSTPTTGTCIGRTAALDVAATTITKLRQYLYDVGKEEQLLDAAVSEVDILTLVLQGQADSIRAVNTASLSPSMKRLEAVAASVAARSAKTQHESTTLSTTKTISSSSDSHIDGSDTHSSTISDTTDLLLAELLQQSVYNHDEKNNNNSSTTTTAIATTPGRRQLGSFLPVLSPSQQQHHQTPHHNHHHPSKLPATSATTESPIHNKNFSTNLSGGLETASIQQLDFVKMKRDLRLGVGGSSGGVGGKSPSSVVSNVKLLLPIPGTTTTTDHTTTPVRGNDAAAKKKNETSSPTFTDQFVTTLTTVPNGDDVRAFLRQQQHLRNNTAAGSTTRL